MVKPGDGTPDKFLKIHSEGGDGDAGAAGSSNSRCSAADVAADVVIATNTITTTAAAAAADAIKWITVLVLRSLSLFTIHKQCSFTQFPTVAAGTLSYSHHALVVYLLAVEWGSPHHRGRRLKFASFVISFSFACSPLKATQQRAATAAAADAASFVVLLLSISWSYFFLAISAAKLDE